MVDDIRERPPVVHRPRGPGRLTKVSKVRRVNRDQTESTNQSKRKDLGNSSRGDGDGHIDERV